MDDHDLILVFDNQEIIRTLPILLPYYTQAVNIATEYGLNPYQISLMVLFSTLAELTFRPVYGRLSTKLAVTRLATVWTLFFFATALAGSFAKGPMMFYLMATLSGFGIAGGNGMKMVLIMECLGQENLRSFIGKYFIAAFTKKLRKI